VFDETFGVVEFSEPAINTQTYAEFAESGDSQEDNDSGAPRSALAWVVGLVSIAAYYFI
jgi:hypothetical protein